MAYNVHNVQHDDISSNINRNSSNESLHEHCYGQAQFQAFHTYYLI